jgi:alpha-tubulin suppressor-like RCC1 family protein
VVSLGLYHSCALSTAGTAACWGYNAQGQATPPAGTFNALGAGGYHTCAIRPTNAIACWGYNAQGQAGPPP